MSNPNETTPLLHNRARSALRHPEIGDGQSQPIIDIAAEARLILSGLTTNHAQITPILGDHPQLAILALLYAAQLVNEDRRLELDEGLSAAVVRDEVGIRRGDRLDDEIEKILGSWATEPGQGGVKDDEFLYDALWMKWDIEGDGRVSALDLMARGKPSRHLSHPIIIRFIEQLYNAGPVSFMSLRPGGILRSIEAAITPRRVAILHSMSHLVLWALTMIIAIRSDSWINSSHHVKSRPQANEITWSIFVSGAMIQIMQSYRRPSRNIFLLPSILALLTSWTTYAKFFLLLSISTLTISMIWSEPPSIPFLFPSLLPASIRVWDIFFAGFRGWGLIWPMIVLLTITLSVSLKGDVFRGLVIIPATFDTGTEEMSPPLEEGVAPYETRLMIFATLVFLLYLAICLSISNIMRTSQSVHSEHGNSRDRDEWVNCHGQDIALRARAKWVLGTRWLVQDLGPNGLNTPSDDGAGDRLFRRFDQGLSLPPVPLPLNIFLIPLDIVDGLVKIIAMIVPVQTDWSGNLRRVRYVVVVWVIGIPCCMLKPFV